MALVEKTLKGAPFEKKLRWKTREGLSVEPLYTPEDGIAAHSLPRMISADPDRPWDLRTIIRHPDPQAANAQVLDDLENGAASVLLRLDPTGRNGIAVASVDDLAAVLEGC
ncbi:methylmalonyl-CoA mutase family protein [Tistrella bauzanensis]